MEVILVPAPTPDKNGVQRYFVQIKGIPGSRGALVVSNALLPEKAEEVRRAIEDDMDEYRRPVRTAKRKPKSIWQRLLEKDV